MGEGSLPESPWTRLKYLLDKALTPVPIGGQVDPVPEELKEWGVNSATVMAGGLVLGGIRQWLEERKVSDGGPLPNLPTKAHVARFKAEFQTRKVARILNSTIRGGLWCGVCGGAYYAVQGLSLYSRQIDDAYNTVFGSWAAGSLMGFSMSSGAINRFGSMALGAGIAGLVGFPIGLLQTYLKEADSPEKSSVGKKETVTPETCPPYRRHDVDLVQQLVSHLENKPAQDSGSLNSKDKGTGK